LSIGNSITDGSKISYGIKLEKIVKIYLLEYNIACIRVAVFGGKMSDSDF